MPDFGVGGNLEIKCCTVNPGNDIHEIIEYFSMYFKLGIHCDTALSTQKLQVHGVFLDVTC